MTLWWIDYVMLALWGWAGILLGALAATEIIERTLHPRFTCPARWKLLAATAILAGGFLSTYLDSRPPTPATPGTVNQQVQEQADRAEAEQFLTAHVEALRRELEKELNRKK